MTARRVVLASGSPSATSKTAGVVRYASDWLEAHGVGVRVLALRELPAADLLAGRADAKGIAETVEWLAEADGLVVGTPIYKAAYSGLLKTWLDLLPQFALAGKAVLPLAVGGSLTGVLAIDYALRPVLASMAARHVVGGYFVKDDAVTLDAERTHLVEPVRGKLDEALEAFVAALG